MSDAFKRVAPRSVAALVASHRSERKLSFGQLARILGSTTPRQTSRLSQRIVKIEREGSVLEKRLIFRLGDVLEIDKATLAQALANQRAEELRGWLRWVNEPVSVLLHIRAMPTVWYSLELGRISEEAAIKIASAQAKDKRSPVCLALNRSLSIWFDAAGEETARAEASPSTPSAYLDTCLR